MGWSIGYDSNWNRDIGYGVPAICDYPGCDEKIDRGLSFVCGGDAYGGETGCGLFFCNRHLAIENEQQQCEQCINKEDPFEPKPDTKEWINHKLQDLSWLQWRKENAEMVKELSQKHL